jgi:hypothetical protein
LVEQGKIDALEKLISSLEDIVRRAKAPAAVKDDLNLSLKEAERTLDDQGQSYYKDVQEKLKDFRDKVSGLKSQSDLKELVNSIVP